MRPALRRIVATSDDAYLIIGKRNENALFRVDLTSLALLPRDRFAFVLKMANGKRDVRDNQVMRMFRLV